MWTASARYQYRRSRARYVTDVADEEFALIEPLLPSAKRGGRRRATLLREVLNALFADAGYQGEVAVCAAAGQGLRLEIVRRPVGTEGFHLLPRRPLRPAGRIPFGVRIIRLLADDGTSSARSLGSDAIDGWPRTSSD
jgi:transposase